MRCCYCCYRVTLPLWLAFMAGAAALELRGERLLKISEELALGPALFIIWVPIWSGSRMSFFSMKFFVPSELLFAHSPPADVLLFENVVVELFLGSPWLSCLLS